MTARTAHFYTPFFVEISIIRSFNQFMLECGGKPYKVIAVSTYPYYEIFIIFGTQQSACNDFVFCRQGYQCRLRPPSDKSTEPIIFLLLARKNISLATSHGIARSPRSDEFLWASPSFWRRISIAVSPGAIPLIIMPCEISFFASHFVSPNAPLKSKTKNSLG